MTAQEAIDLFYKEMLSEILNAPTDEPLQQYFIDALKEVKQTVTDTLNASK